MRIGSGGGNARRDEGAVEAGGSKARRMKEGLADLKGKAGEKLAETARDAKYALTHPKETARDAAAGVRRKARMVGQGAKTLAREPAIRAAIPKGLPKPPIGGKLGRALDKEPVGPNYFESLPPAERKGKSPNYPVSYSIPAEHQGGGFRATGHPANFTTGPGLLPQQYRVPGRFDYDAIPNLNVSPHAGRDIAAGPGEGPSAADHARSMLMRAGRNGLPADPETGFPNLPDLGSGSYTLGAHVPPPRRATDPSLDGPVRKKPKDPLEFEDLD